MPRLGPFPSQSELLHSFLSSFFPFLLFSSLSSLSYPLFPFFFLLSFLSPLLFLLSSLPSFLSHLFSLLFLLYSLFPLLSFLSLLKEKNGHKALNRTLEEILDDNVFLEKYILFYTSYNRAKEPTHNKNKIVHSELKNLKLYDADEKNVDVVSPCVPTHFTVFFVRTQSGGV